MRLDSNTKKNLATEHVVIGEVFYKIFLWGNCEVQEGGSPTQHHLLLGTFFEILFCFNFFHVFREKYFCKSAIFLFVEYCVPVSAKSFRLCNIVSPLASPQTLLVKGHPWANRIFASTNPNEVLFIQLSSTCPRSFDVLRKCSLDF